MSKKAILFIISFIGIGFISYFVFNSYIQALLITFLINGIMGLSLNFITGVANQFSLGSAGFMALGAYTSAILTKELFGAWYFIPVSAVIAAGVAGAAGYLVSLPSFRLKGDYLAIVTLGFAEIVRVIFLNWDWVGGARGYNGITKWPDFFWSYLFTGSATLISFFVLYNLKKSWFGRNLWAINEDEIAAEVMGTPVAQTKRMAFLISSFFGGLGGAMYSHHLGYISPGSFGFLMTVNILIITVLGGLGSMSGTLVSAALLTALPELLRSLPTGGVDLRMVIFPILLILIMILRPQGLFGRNEIGDSQK